MVLKAALADSRMFPSVPLPAASGDED
jgi:hypothetical protein